MKESQWPLEESRKFRSPTISRNECSCSKLSHHDFLEYSTDGDKGRGLALCCSSWRWCRLMGKFRGRTKDLDSGYSIEEA